VAAAHIVFIEFAEAVDAWEKRQDGPNDRYHDHAKEEVDHTQDDRERERILLHSGLLTSEAGAMLRQF
jgi:hypothetical protein